jgi:hypothetical protein
MFSALTEFTEGIKSLDAFLQCTIEEDLLLEEMPALKTIIPAESQVWAQYELLISNKNNKKIYVYSAAIIRLYGLFERYVESLIANYLKYLTEIVPTYENLPENIRRNHVSLSLELISGVTQDWYRGTHTEKSLVANLNSCLSGDKNYILNIESFVIHRANFRIQQLTDQLNKVGIQNLLRKISNSEAFRIYFLKENPGANIEKISDPDLKTLFSQIDELATIRNAISHGHSPDELESVELLKKRLDFIQAFCVGLSEAAIANALPIELEQSSPISLGKPIKVYGNSIVCFKLKNIGLKVGDKLIAETGDSIVAHKSSSIESIELDSKSLNEIVIAEEADIAIKVAFKAKENYSYHLIVK